MYHAIKHQQPKLSKSKSGIWLSEEGKLVLKQLMNKNPNERLGAHGGVNEVEKHPFFAPYEFSALESKLLKPPFIPKVSSVYDCSNVDKIFIESPVGKSVDLNASMMANVSSANTGNSFQAFSYVRPMIK